MTQAWKPMEALVLAAHDYHDRAYWSDRNEPPPLGHEREFDSCPQETCAAIRADIARSPGPAVDFVPYDADPDHGQCPLCGEDGTARSEVEAYNAAIRAAEPTTATALPPHKWTPGDEPPAHNWIEGDGEDAFDWLAQLRRTVARAWRSFQDGRDHTVDLAEAVTALRAMDRLEAARLARETTP